MKHIDALIAKFKEFKEELNKGVNMSYAPAPNMSKGTGIDMVAMSQKEKLSLSKNGQWKLDKCGTNEEANPSGNHNKEKFKVMPMVEEKSSKKEEVKGKPYMDKAESCAKCGNGPCTCELRDDNKGHGGSATP